MTVIPSAPASSPADSVNADGQWLRDLNGSGQHQPASTGALVAEVTAELGEGPVAWAVDLGHQMATRIIAEIPPLGGGPEAFETLRMGTESATLRSMLLLVSNDPARIGVTPEALEGDRDFVRRGVSLDQVLRGIRLGHSLMAHGFLDAATKLVDEPRRAAEMKRTSDMLFEYIDDFASSMATEYLAERDRWVASAAAARAEMVHAILDKKAVSTAEARASLSYPLDHHHVGFVLWRDSSEEQSHTDLQRSAAEMLRDTGCSGTLMIPHGASSLWVWAAWRSSSDATTDFSASQLTDIWITVGTPARGVDGFRRTHREAEQVAALSRTTPAGPSVIHFSDVELAVLLAQEPELAQNFVRTQLGPIAADTPSAAELRETVAAYLANDRSLVRAGEELHVARNTVAYRVKKFENLTGRDLKEHRLNIEAALVLASFLGPQALDNK